MLQMLCCAWKEPAVEQGKAGKMMKRNWLCSLEVHRDVPALLRSGLGCKLILEMLGIGNAFSFLYCCWACCFYVHGIGGP